MKNLFLILSLLILFQGCATDRANETEERTCQEYSLVTITDIEPRGWLHEFLVRQREGLTGHIEETGYPFNTGMWTGRIQLDPHTEKEKERSFSADGVEEKPDTGVFWWPYEQTGYYIDGTIKAGYLLGDSFLINRAREQIEYNLDNPREDGRMAPAKMIGRWHNWPYAGFFRSFMTEYQVSGDERIIEAMHRHYLTFSAEDFQDELDVCNVEELCWLFEKTGDTSLLQMAEEAYALNSSRRENRNRDGRNMVFTSDRKPDYHGVVYFEIVKIPALLYSCTGKEAYLDEALQGIEKMERYNMLASGVPSTTEHLNGTSVRAGHESCNLATLPYTYGIMLRTTGEPAWADKIEKAVFNAGIGAITKNFTAHQYFSAPNQVIVTLNSNHFGYYPTNLAYCPGHIVSCCTGNIHRFMPYYIMQMWLKTKNNGIAAALYGPSEISTRAGEANVPVTIKQHTHYPFDEAIEFEISTEEKTEFEFQLRIPSWCKDPEISLNGTKLEENIEPGTFYTLHREFSDGDRITLSLPMNIETTKWPGQGVSFERGPIVYSYPVPDSTVLRPDFEKASENFPACEFYPAGAWQYSPLLDGTNGIKMVRNDKSSYPWDPDAPPVKLIIGARKIKNWDLKKVREEKNGEIHYETPGFPEDPVFSEQIQNIELIPYGCTYLRLTVFPTGD